MKIIMGHKYRLTNNEVAIPERYNNSVGKIIGQQDERTWMISFLPGESWYVCTECLTPINIYANEEEI
jgi:hypothetical protein